MHSASIKITNSECDPAVLITSQAIADWTAFGPIGATQQRDFSFPTFGQCQSVTGTITPAICPKTPLIGISSVGVRPRERTTLTVSADLLTVMLMMPCEIYQSGIDSPEMYRVDLNFVPYTEAEWRTDVRARLNAHPYPGVGKFTIITPNAQCQELVQTNDFPVRVTGVLPAGYRAWSFLDDQNFHVHEKLLVYKSSPGSCAQHGVPSAVNPNVSFGALLNDEFKSEFIGDLVWAFDDCFNCGQRPTAPAP